MSTSQATSIMKEEDIEKQGSASSSVLGRDQEGAVKEEGGDGEVKFVAPDGGLKAWLTVFGAYLLQFCSFGFLNACGIFQAYYQVEVLPSYSSSAITWITTIQLFLFFFFGPVVGTYLDVLGPRKIIGPGAILVVLGVCMMSLCNEYWQFFLAQGVCFGLGGSTLFMPPMVMVGQWFNKKRGLATGLMASGSASGGVIFPIFLNHLIPQLGFRVTLRWTALFLGILLLTAWCLVTSPLPPSSSRTTKPKPKPNFAALKNTTIIIFLIGCWIFFWGFFAPFNYLPLFAEVHAGFSTKMAGYTASIVNAGSVPGRILPGILADRFGPFNVLVCLAMLTGLMTLCFWLPVNYAPSHAGVLIYGCLYGVFSGGFLSLMMPAFMSLDPTADPASLGARLGAFMGAISISVLTGLPVLGAISDSENGAFGGLIVFSAVCVMAGACLLGVVRWRKVGLRLEKC